MILGAVVGVVVEEAEGGCDLGCFLIGCKEVVNYVFYKDSFVLFEFAAI